MTQDSGATVDAVLGRALDAYAVLAELGEEIDDEWTYVNDLATAWRDRLEAIATARHGDAISPAAVVAVDGAIDEIGRISDPHRAIDWLSTYPQVVLLALEERP
ncbi:MAG TPA: hypothetical protein VGQ02_09970 [Candidatus Limnocylindrales bacterium]|nr:hypothetical protein [Candidatus Limnocylindrales bacterium]